MTSAPGWIASQTVNIYKFPLVSVLISFKYQHATT